MPARAAAAAIGSARRTAIAALTHTIIKLPRRSVCAFRGIVSTDFTAS